MISIQAATKHEHVAVITGLYLATFNIGSACGSTLSAAIITQKLVPNLMDTLPVPYHNNRTFAELIRAAPSHYIVAFPVGTSVRDSMIVSYRDVHGLLASTSLGLCTLLIGFAAFIRNTELVARQSHPQAETNEMYGYEAPEYEDQGWVMELRMNLWMALKT